MKNIRQLKMTEYSDAMRTQKKPVNLIRMLKS